MKVAEFSELGNIIEKFSKKGEKVASIWLLLIALTSLPIM
jgi:hypothetical protein